MSIFYSTFLRFLYSIAVVFILVRFFYYPKQGKKEFVFTYLLFSTMIALLCILISRDEMSFGFALGIFAIFSLMRYRTAQISTREMTYLFLSAGIAAKNLLAPADLKFQLFLVTDGSIIVMAAISEYFLFRDKDIKKMLIYDDLSLIHPDKHEELKKDLSKRFGINEIKSIKIGRIDAPKNTVHLLVTFRDTDDFNFYEE
jgi:Domain of unknown function (DUF4956)